MVGGVKKRPKLTRPQIKELLLHFTLEDDVAVLDVEKVDFKTEGATNLKLVLSFE